MWCHVCEFYAWHAFLGLKARGRVFAAARLDGTQWPTIPNVEHLDTECGGVVTLQSEVTTIPRSEWCVTLPSRLTPGTS